MEQTHLVTWIRTTETWPVPGVPVLASTKDRVYILQLHMGRPQMKDDYSWMDRLGKRSDIQFADVIAWAELP
jgi:hypothetical protein